MINSSIKNLINKTLDIHNKLNHYEIVSFSEGLDALKFLLDQSTFHSLRLVIADEEIHHIEGTDIIRFIRNLEIKNNHNKIMILSLTSSNADKVSQNILSNNIFSTDTDKADLSILKPVTLPQVEEVFKKLHLI